MLVWYAYEKKKKKLTDIGLLGFSRTIGLPQKLTGRLFQDLEWIDIVSINFCNKTKMTGLA